MAGTPTREGRVFIEEDTFLREEIGGSPATYTEVMLSLTTVHRYRHGFTDITCTPSGRFGHAGEQTTYRPNQPSMGERYGEPSTSIPQPQPHRSTLASRLAFLLEGLRLVSSSAPELDAIV